MKYIILFIFSLSLNASILLDKAYPICIEDYYIAGGTLYYLRSVDNTWGSTTADKSVQEIYYGYDYNTSSGYCSPKSYNIDLGLSYFDFNFLMALSGVLFAALIFYLFSSFLIGL
ncbi:MAG: hypothetical protein COA39_011870 [Sulfurimonas sp.]|nr:hypothetical protein [Sulfurimonas sp.]